MNIILLFKMKRIFHVFFVPQELGGPVDTSG